MLRSTHGDLLKSGAEAVISERAEFLVGHALGGIGGDRMAS